MAKKPRWETSPTIGLNVSEGFDLATFDATATPGFTGGKSDGEAFMARRGELMSELQERFYANSKTGDERKLLVVVQGLDTAGKGGIARHVLGMVDPQGVQLAYFGVPTEEEASHDFLWRIEKKLPAPGRIGLFDRSHYEDVLVQRVDNIVPQEVWEKRYDQINEWEKNLVENENFTIIKVALMVTHREQGLRLAERIARPDKWWKFSTSDVKTRHKWDQYQEAYQAVFDRTSTEWAPWFVIPANEKWYSRLAVTELITQALIDFDQHWPIPEWDREVETERLIATMALEDVEAARQKLADKRDAVLEHLAEFNNEVAEVDAEGDADAGDSVVAPAAEPDSDTKDEPKKDDSEKDKKSKDSKKDKSKKDESKDSKKDKSKDSKKDKSKDSKKDESKDSKKSKDDKKSKDSKKAKQSKK